MAWPLRVGTVQPDRVTYGGGDWTPTPLLQVKGENGHGHVMRGRRWWNLVLLGGRCDL